MNLIKLKREEDFPMNTSFDRSMSGLRRQVDQVMDDLFWGSHALTPSRATELGFNTAFMPHVNLSETEKEYKVTAELPGIEKKEIDLSVTDNTLILKGEKTFEEKQEKENFRRVERSYGSFYRAIPLAEPIEETKVQAEFKNGLLTVRIAKSTTHTAKAKKVEIS